MVKAFTLRIGDIYISIKNQNTYNYDLGRYQKFQSTGPASSQLNLISGKIPDLAGARQVFDNGIGCVQYRDGDKKYIALKDTGNEPVQVGVFNNNFRDGDIFSNLLLLGDYENHFFPLEGPMGEVFMINLLGTGLGVCVHACGIADRDRGYIFAGFGGAGKSTTARLWQDTPGAVVFNDDRLILRKMKNGFWVYSTPWHGTGGVSLPISAPASKIFILRQANNNYAKPLNPPEAAANLLARSFPPIWDREAMEYTLDFYRDLCQSVPCYELGFVPDQSIVEYIRCMK